MKISFFHSSTKILNMAKPYGKAIWLCHMVLPYPRFWSKTEKVRSFKKKWDLLQLPNIGLVTHDDLLKISIWPRVEKLVPSTPRGSRYDFYGQLDSNLWPSWWKSGKTWNVVKNEVFINFIVLNMLIVTMNCDHCCNEQFIVCFVINKLMI